MSIKEFTNNREKVVEAFLLQQHRTLLSRLTITRISYRIINLAILGFLLANSLSLLGLTVSIFVTYVVAVIWYFEDRSIVKQLSVIEKAIARIAGGDSEDLYIQTRYEAADKIPRFIIHLLRSEPFLWFIATTFLLSFQLAHTLKP